MEVFRGGPFLLIGGKFYSLKSAVDASFAKVIGAGSDNPAFDAPPWFYSGSPYGKAILALGISEVEPPVTFLAEWLPQSKPGWSARKPAWPEIFGVQEINVARDQAMKEVK